MTPIIKRMLKILAWAVAVLALVLIVVTMYVLIRWDAPVDRTAPALTAARDSATVARGEYIYRYQAQCWSCHASGPGGANAAPAGGTPFDLTDVGPGFGVWYTPNITPDIETGIGGWSDGEIVQAIREGVRKDRKALFPLMPVDWFHGLADNDALAIVAYLRSLPPVVNAVPDRKPSVFAKALFALGILKPKDAITSPVSAPTPGPTAAYGRYLAQNLSGCMDCHTPRNLQNGEFYLDSLGAGSTISFGSAEGQPIASFARNLTPDPETGIGRWSEADFISAVTVGMRPDGTVLDPHMPYAYYKSYTADDLRAIYLFLRELPPVRRAPRPSSISPALTAAKGTERGKLLFQGRCQACHGRDGSGAQPTHASLAEVAASINDSDLKEFISNGDLDLKMPAFGKTLREDELADIVAFIRTFEKK